MMCFWKCKMCVADCKGHLTSHEVNVSLFGLGYLQAFTVLV